MYNLNELENEPEEVIDDIKSSMEINYLHLKTDSKFEVALAYENGDYTYLESSNNIEEAINIAKNQVKQVKENVIPVVINEDGLVVYATEGIGRVVKIIDGVPVAENKYIAPIFKNENDRDKNSYTSINHGYIDDVPIIEDNGKRVKIEVNGLTGWINKEDSEGINIIQVPMNQVKNLSYYKKSSDGKLNHYISNDISKDVLDPGSGHNRVIGVAPEFMEIDKEYYSYDGNYFYNNVEDLIYDLRHNNHNKSVNSSNPYYNYYTYLPGRSKTSYSVSQINSYLENETPSNSILKGKGQAFVDAQNKYGVNSDIIIGIAMNESKKGISDIAIKKNNIFGINAVDSDTGQAIVFKTVEECIDYFAKEYMSNGYLNPKSWKYTGSNVGNKDTGMNVWYASDPYWGEKAGDFMHDMDKVISRNKDLISYNSYQIGVYTSENVVSNSQGIELYEILNTRSKQGQVGDPVLILSNKLNQYEIYPDRQIPMDAINPSPGSYDWNIKGYINSYGVKLINTKVSKPTTPEKYGWVKENGAWYYYKEDGTLKKGWLDLNGKWYYLKSDGKMATGWEKVNGKWYYLNYSGEMKKGWLDLSGNWYYLRGSGEMAIGWEKVDGKWYYLNSNGTMKKGWLDLSGSWYYLRDSGAMAIGWEKVDGKWYYLNSNGTMKKGWLNLSGNWYYLRGSGAMAIGWEKVNGKWYYFNSSGVMLKNTTIDGWKIDSNGVATPIR